MLRSPDTLTFETPRVADWDSVVRDFLRRAGRRSGLNLSGEALDALPKAYRYLVPARRAARDLALIAANQNESEIVELRPLRGPGVGDARYEVRLIGAKDHALDELLPMLQNLGLRVADQIQFALNLSIGPRFIRSFIVEPSMGSGASVARSHGRLLAALKAVLSAEVESDALNGLVLVTELDWRQIDLFRAYSNYYQQLGLRIERTRIYRALLHSPAVAQLLYRYFQARFEPDGGGRDSFEIELELLTPIRAQLVDVLDKVADGGDDRILRDLFNLIDATVRTNFYFCGDWARKFISLKISSLGVFNMPSPKPMAEIYVHSPSMEGVHLRGAKVARGGIRWSDRPEDFRGEVLALMQTQMIKNALIVPQGAKGGFVLKLPFDDASQRQRLGREAYSQFLRGLLDLTDNLKDSQIVRPPALVAYDGPDPYLVVAADKGTASWADVANEISHSYGFWLGDAFASGGAHGYHHKRLGITARGAWVCVRRHFHELGHNVDAEPITVVGVGSMDGDVFGNGMLHTPNIRLLGAFDGQYIFIDPDPDPLISFAERRRLFQLPRSTWRDYNPALLSQGGGVYRRDAKDIPLSPEVRAWLGVRHSAIDGESLVRWLLIAPVDLLWMGGVGTYVKASSETNESVGDRVNDGARVDALQLRAKVVGEGANLAFTQRARIEYALRGGRINTDAVDNSAGVDLSDHEVNLKTLLQTRPDQHTPDVEDPDRLLQSLTEEVCASVLQDNDRQSLCLSLDRARCRINLDQFMDLAEQLENAGYINPAAEAFPTRKDVSARETKELTRPELALLMASSKLALKQRLLEDEAFLQGSWSYEFLASYFPEYLRSHFSERIRSHSLAREIAVTVICNKVVDQAGVCFLLLGEGLVPTLLSYAVKLYLSFDRIFEGDRWRASFRESRELDAACQYALLLQLEDALAYMCHWSMRRGHRLSPDDEDIERWRSDLRAYRERVGVSEAQGDQSVAAPYFDRLRNFPFLVALTRESGEDMRVAGAYFDKAANLFGLQKLTALLADVKPRDLWEQQLQAALDARMRDASARIASMQLLSGIADARALFRNVGLEFRLAGLERLAFKLEASLLTTLTPFAAFVAELNALVDACDAAYRSRSAEGAERARKRRRASSEAGAS
ncbi:NAD-glutamate dehydrogenase domain-containing protein [Methylocystis rosea]|uniref:NAD-glutamate dehydrogenase domain-containing protein n=1 Tax=Methylocystis rosea TaxID=173366 RepID=UPI00036FDF3D|nr:NAD-glutamate dehydrogenase domain-containing protein [Methylocystis rosea]